ncbi:MAG: DUF7088 domain-containing protein [Phycisphaerae bacterium]
MAVDSTSSNTQSRGGQGPQRMLVGTNVLVATVLALGVVVVAQVIAYKWPKQIDMTSTGVNSLSDGTKNLLDSLDQNVELTSLYFEAGNLEDEDQPRYRRVMDDLLGLYAATNRGKVKADWINPLDKNREKISAFYKELGEHPSFQGDLEKSKARVEVFTAPDGLGERLNVFLQDDLQQIAALNLASDESTQKAVGPVEILLQRWSEELTNTLASIRRESTAEPPQYSGSIEALKQVYEQLPKSLTDIQTHAERVLATNGDISANAAGYLNGCGARYAPLMEEMTREADSLNELEAPKFDELMQEIASPTGNAIVVKTDSDVEVVKFGECWPALDPTAQSAALSFDQRAFRGEEKLTAALLRATHQESTAVIFVRYGGTPLLGGLPIPGQPRGPYMVMKENLADANFEVKEWDLKTNDNPPGFDPEPTRKIFVVLKPNPPQRDPMGRMGQDPPFTDRHKDLLINAIGDDGRAVFIAGWHPGPFGPVPSSYEYGDYLKDTWGIEVDSTRLLLTAISTAPGKYAADGRSFFLLQDATASDHITVRGAQQKYALPWCAPLILAESPPEGVTVSMLLEQEEADTIWGVQDITAYEKQLQEQQYMTLAEGDTTGDFILAAAAEKGDAKIVVVSSRAFAEDAVAFAREIVFGARGLQVISRNPGNVSLFVNSLHWLNDNTEFMNIGSPIDLAVLKIDGTATIKTVSFVAIVVWPSLALLGGAAAWWIRRR